MKSRIQVLIRLIGLRLKGGLRHRLGEMRSLKGLVYLILTITVLVYLLAGHGGYWMAGNANLERTDWLRDAREWLAPGLIIGAIITALSASGPPIYFNAAEINFLFAGPFSRPALILYKWILYAVGALTTATVSALLLAASDLAFGAVISGIAMSLLLVQLLSANLVMVGAMLGKAARWIRYSVLILLTWLIISLLWRWWTGGDWVADLIGLITHPLLNGLSWPAHFFTALLFAESVSEWLRLFLPALFIVATLVCLSVFLDGRCGEQQLEAGIRLRRRWQRFKSGHYQSFDRQTAMSVPMAGRRGFRLQLRRQQLVVQRAFFKPIGVLAALALVVGPILISIPPATATGIGFFIVVMLLPRILVMDFRSDREVIENLKGLPIGSLPLCAGQLAWPVGIAITLQWVMLISAAFYAPSERLLSLVLIGIFLIPINALIVQLDNLFFLLFPASLVPIGRVDFEFFGRTLLELAAKSVVLGVAIGLSAGISLILMRWFGGGWWVYATLSWVGLLGCALLLWPVVAWAFRTVDVEKLIAF